MVVSNIVYFHPENWESFPIFTTMEPTTNQLSIFVAPFPGWPGCHGNQVVVPSCGAIIAGVFFCADDPPMKGEERFEDWTDEAWTNYEKTPQNLRLQKTFIQNTRVVATQISCYFHSYLTTWGNDPIWLLHIFQMGWFNHQLEDDDLNLKLPCIESVLTTLGSQPSPSAMIQC